MYSGRQTTAVFEIRDASGDVIDTVTVSNGVGRSTLIPVGEYTVVEITAPEGYPLDDRLEQNILEKKVTVSGDQDPTVDFSDVSPTAEDGYTDKVIFPESIRNFNKNLCRND